METQELAEVVRRILHNLTRLTRRTAKQVLDAITGPSVKESTSLDPEQLKGKTVSVLALCGGVGDRVFEIYMLQELAKQLGAKIHIFTHPRDVFLFENNPYIAAVHTTDILLPGVLRQKLPSSLDPDLFVLLAGKGTNRRFNIIASRIRGRHTQFLHINPDTRDSDLDKNGSTVDKILQETQGKLNTALMSESQEPVIHIGSKDEAYIQQREEQYNVNKETPVFTLCVGATDMTRNYHERGAVAKELHKRNSDAKIILSGDLHAKTLADNIFKQLGSPNRLIPMAGKTTLRETTALLRRSQLVIAADSGPGNISMGLAKPKVLMLYSRIPGESRIPSFVTTTQQLHTNCPGVSEPTCPYGNLTHIEGGGGQTYCSCMESISPEAIVGKALSMLEKSAKENSAQ